jgi:hypothetical protein
LYANDLDLAPRYLSGNQKLPHSNFDVKANSSYYVKTEYINLDHSHLGSNPKLILEPSLVSIGKSKLKLLSGNWISISSNSNLDHRHLGSSPKLPLDISYLYTKFGVNRLKQTHVIERKLNSFFSNSDLNHRHLGSNPKLHLDISYLHTKFGVNRAKQTKVIERKPKTDTRPPASRYNNPVFVENMVFVNIHLLVH